MARTTARELRTHIETLNSALEQAEQQLGRNYQMGIFGQDVRAQELEQRVEMLSLAAVQATQDAVARGDMTLAFLAAKHSAPALLFLSKLSAQPGARAVLPRSNPNRRNPLPAFDPQPDARSRAQGSMLLAAWLSQD
jgi:hypothetical protein